MGFYIVSFTMLYKQCLYIFAIRIWKRHADIQDGAINRATNIFCVKRLRIQGQSFEKTGLFYLTTLQLQHWYNERRCRRFVLLPQRRCFMFRILQPPVRYIPERAAGKCGSCPAIRPEGSDDRRKARNRPAS